MNNLILGINIPSILMSEINKNTKKHHIILIVSDRISGLIQNDFQIQKKSKAKQKEINWKLSLPTYHELLIKKKHNTHMFCI